MRDKPQKPEYILKDVYLENGAQEGGRNLTPRLTNGVCKKRRIYFTIRRFTQRWGNS